MPIKELQEKREREEQAVANALLISHDHVKDLPWPEQVDLAALLNRVSARQEGKTMAQADAKRKPYDALCQKILDERMRQWNAFWAQYGPAEESTEAPRN